MLKLKKEDYNIWERFIVMSDAEWRRCKRKNKDKCILNQFDQKASFKKAFERRLDKNEQKLIPAKLLLAKLS